MRCTIIGDNMKILGGLKPTTDSLNNKPPHVTITAQGDCLAFYLVDSDRTITFDAREFFDHLQKIQTAWIVSK